MPPFSLIVRRAAEVVDELVLEPGIVTIGRSASSGIALDDARLSRCHAMLTVDDNGSCHLQDAGSRNGTFVRGERIGRIPLNPGDQFYLGSHCCELRASSAAGERVAVRADVVTEDATRSGGVVVDPTIERVRFLGTSSSSQQLLRLVQRVGATRVSALVTGESGSGKDLVARLIHGWSDRADGPFVSVNCAAIPRELIESELFGHRKGSFTGAVSDQIGKFRAADGGTLFLDEVGDMGLEAQAKILRALEGGQIEPIGGPEAIAVDVRVIAATNRDLEAAIVAGSFREDLLYRLGTVRVAVPPLRERPEDIALLANHFLVDLAHEVPTAAGSYFTNEAMNVLVGYRWPGNVRELRNVVAQALMVKDGPEIRAAHLSVGDVERDAETSLTLSPLERAEAKQIEAALEQNGWNLTRTAEALSINRKTLRKRVQKFGLVRQLS